MFVGSNAGPFSVRPTSPNFVSPTLDANTEKSCSLV